MRKGSALPAGISIHPRRDVELPLKLLPILKPRRFKILYGGRGGAKSHSVAQALLMLGLRKSLRILCARETQKSLAESSKQLLEDYITILGLDDYYVVLKTEIRSRINGTIFKFTGLREHTAHSLKSFEGYDICWVEEAHAVTAHSWNILIPTIRKETGGPFGKGSEIWATYNPDDEKDYVHDRFVVNIDPDALVIKVNWRDNPWFGKIMNTERLRMKALNDDLYNHIWEGRCRTAAGLLFKRKWFKRYAMRELPRNLIKYLSSDYAVTDESKSKKGHPPDFTEFGVFGVDENGDIWILDWYSGQVDPKVWIAAAVKLITKHNLKLWFEETGVIRRSQDSAIDRILNRKRIFVHREGLPSAGAKAERALGFMALASMGHVHIPRGPAWAERLINQLCSFTGQDGRTDDGVDVCSLFSRGLDFVAVASRKTGKRKEIKPFTRAWFEQQEQADDVEERKRKFYGR